MLAARVRCLLSGLAAGRQALERTAGPDTLVLLGVTRTDTGPAFFDALDTVREGRPLALQFGYSVLSRILLLYMGATSFEEVGHIYIALLFAAEFTPT